MDWLEEMEKLGEGHKYKPLIKTEIEERLRSIKKLQPHSNGDKWIRRLIKYRVFRVKLLKSCSFRFDIVSKIISLCFYI